MIRKLKLKFIALSATSLLILLALMIVCMNYMNYASIVRRADEDMTQLEREADFFSEDTEKNDKFEEEKPTRDMPDAPAAREPT